MKMKLEYKVQIPTANKLMKRLGVQQEGPLHREMKGETIRMLDPYVPYDTGRTREAAAMQSELPPVDLITYNPQNPRNGYHYASAIYYVGPYSNPEARYQQKSGGSSVYGSGVGTRGKYWLQRAWVDHRVYFTAHLQEMLSKGGFRKRDGK